MWITKNTSTRILPAAFVSIFIITACGGNSGSDSNTPPTADAGSDQSVNENTLVNLAGMGSDAEGPVTYQWTQSGGPSITLIDSTSTAASFNSPDVNADTVITLQLTVTDSAGVSTSDSVDINVLDQSPPINTSPAANAGSDQAVTELSNVTLNGTGSDAESAVTYQWSQTRGPTVAINNAFTAAASFTAPDVSADTVFTFLLTVTDTGGLTATDSIDITVSDSTPNPTNTFTHRVKTVRYDFDNNGVFEGQSDYSYNADGTIASITYTYTDDGAADTDFISFSLGPFLDTVENETQIFSYGTDGLLEFWDINSTNESSRVSYTWNGESAFDTASLESFNMGAQVGTIDFSGSYNSGLLSFAAGVVTFPVMPNPLTQDIELSYDAFGVLQSDLWTVTQNNMIATQLRRDFTWDANGAIDLTVSTDPRPGATYQDSRDYEYVNDRITKVVATLPSNHYAWYENFDANNLYVERLVDLNDDNSVEGRVTTEWEAGTCKEVVFWMPRTTPYTLKRTTNPSPLVSLGDGHGVFPTCGTASP